jgi:UDP-N-acetylglucosamine 2-epimerase
LRAVSVIDCEPVSADISAAIEVALRGNWANVENPYGDGRASERIRDVLSGIDDWSQLVYKKFWDLPAPSKE